MKIQYPGAQAQWKILQDYSLKKYIDEEHSVSEMELGVDFMDELASKTNDFGTSK